MNAAENFGADILHSYKIAGRHGWINASACRQGFYAASVFERRGSELERRSKLVALFGERDLLNRFDCMRGRARNGLHGDLEAPEDLGRLFGIDALVDDGVEDLGDGFLNGGEVLGNRKSDVAGISLFGSCVDASVEIAV